MSVRYPVVQFYYLISEWSENRYSYSWRWNWSRNIGSCAKDFRRGCGKQMLARDYCTKINHSLLVLSLMHLTYSGADQMGIR